MVKVFYGGRPRPMFLSKIFVKEVSRMATKSIFGWYGSHFELRDPDGGYSHLDSLRKGGLWYCLEPFLDGLVAELIHNGIIDVDVKINYRTRSFSVYVYPDTEDYHKFDDYIEDCYCDDLEEFLNDLAYRVASSLWYMEENLLMDYYEELA